MPNPQPLILLPPSEGKAPGGDGLPWSPGTMADQQLDRDRRKVVAAAVRAGRLTRRAPTAPAMERYSGVLYKELDWSTLPAAARRHGNRQVRIVSGLWGVVAPTDPIPHYRLKMGASLGELGRLARWWRPKLAPLLADRSQDALVWDLLPIEHKAAMDWTTCHPRQRVVVRFLDSQDRTVSHWNKLLKGSLVRWLLATQPSDVEALRAFEHPLGYRYDPAATCVDDTVTNVVLRQCQ